LVKQYVILYHFQQTRTAVAAIGAVPRLLTSRLDTRTIGDARRADLELLWRFSFEITGP
jgi:hypothetical protein